MIEFIKIKVHPASKKNNIIMKSSDSYEIWTKAKAEGGLANKAVLEILANTLKIERKKLKIIKGSRIQSKIVKIL